MLNLNEFAKEVHANAVAHGWWETDRPFYEVLALIHSEISEALEEYRAGRPMVWYKCTPSDVFGKCECRFNAKHCIGCCDASVRCKDRDGKPEGVAVELIDMCIRILDWFGFIGITDIPTDPEKDMELAYEKANICELPKLCADLHNAISCAYAVGDFAWNRCDIMYDAIMLAFVWIKDNGLDPEALLIEKHEYNKTRPYKHGGKVC